MDHSDNALVNESSAFTTIDQVLRNESSANTTATNELCLSQNVYTGDVCRNVLLAYQACLTGRIASADTDIFISMFAGVSQEEVEDQVEEILGGLQLLNPSQDCLTAALPFFCRYALPLCDSSGELYLPSSGECEALTTETCAREWQIAISFLGSENLPQCVLLPADSNQCTQGMTYERYVLHNQSCIYLRCSI